MSEGSRVLATGKVARAPRGAKVVLEGHDGGKWAALGHAAVARGGFAIGFTAPGEAATMQLRAILLSGRRHLAHSTIRRLRVVVDAGTPSPPGGSPPTPGQTANSTEPGVIALVSPATTVMVGSTTPVVLPKPLISAAPAATADNAPPGVSVLARNGGLTVSAGLQAVPGSATLTVTGKGCSATECGVQYVLKIPLTVSALATPAGTLDGFTEPSPDRIATAVGQQLPDELLVVLGTPTAPGSQAEAEAAAQSVDGILSGGLPGAGVYEIRWSTPQSLEQREDELSTQAGVTAVNRFSVEEFVENAAVPTATAYDKPQWLWPYEQADVEGAWNDSVGSSTKVGVIDVGNVYEGHDDLNVVEVSNPKGGYAPAGHATHVAGLACAKANDQGVVGMAWGCPIVSSAVGSDQHAFYTTVLEAMESMALDASVRVVNISLGHSSGCVTSEESAAISNGYGEYAAMYKQVFAGIGRNIVWTISAGNNCAPEIASPMAADGELPNVIVVGATNSGGELATFSNYGPTVSVAAPGGVAVPPLQEFGPMSTWVSECAIDSPQPCGCTGPYCAGYKQDWGTSMAAPQVAGIAADVWAAHPAMDGGEIAECVKGTAGTAGAGTATAGSQYPQAYVPLLDYPGGIPIVDATAAVECSPEGSGSGGIEWRAANAPLPANGPQEYDSNYFYSAACSSDGTCVMPGEYPANAAEDEWRDMIETFSAGSWTAIDAPAPGGGSPDSYSWLFAKPACTAGSTCMIFDPAYYDAEHEFHSLVETLSGGTWTPSVLPVPPGGKAGGGQYAGWSATATCSESTAVCMFLGRYEIPHLDEHGEEDPQEATMIGMYSNGSWTATEMPVPAGGEADSGSGLSGYEQGACAANGTCVLPGEYRDGGQDHPMLESNSDGFWTATPLPVPPGGQPGSGAFFEEEATGGPVSTASMWCGSAGVCFAPARYRDGDGVEREMIETLSDGTWKSSQVPVPAGGEAGSAVITPREGACSPAGVCVLPGWFHAVDGGSSYMIDTLADGNWQATRAPAPDGGEANGGGQAACSADGTCVVIGTYASADSSHYMVNTLVDGSWSATPLPLPRDAKPGSGELFGATSPTCTANGTCVLAGEYENAAGEERDMIDTFADGKWSSIRTPVPSGGEGGSGFASFNLVACASATEVCVAPGFYRNASGETARMVLVGEGRP